MPGRRHGGRGQRHGLQSSGHMLMLGRHDTREDTGKPLESQMQNLLGYAAENNQ